MVDTSTIPGLLARHGVTAHVGNTFDDPDNPLPRGLRTVIGHKAAA
jgi:hypothetical protein